MNPHDFRLIPGEALAQELTVYLDDTPVKTFSCVGLDNINYLIQEANDIVGIDNWNRIEITVEKLEEA